jgi:hypothetical protein
LKQRQIWWESTVKVLILVMLLLYPGIATRVFSVLRCTSVREGGKLFLALDFNIVCFGDEHSKRLALAAVCMIVYVVGIPLGVFATLYKNRDHLHDATSPQHRAIKFELGGLYQQYEQRFWWFEIVIIFYKMAMTGALSIIAPGTPLQMVLAILVSLAFVLLVLKLAPFESNMDDHVSFVSSLSLVLATFGGLLLIMDNGAKKYFEPDTIGTLIIVMTCCVFVFQLVNILLVKAASSCGRKDGKTKEERAQYPPSAVVPVQTTSTLDAALSGDDLEESEAMTSSKPGVRAWS